MNYTQNYQLPQWVETDRILRTDFNDSYEKIDAALKTNADGLSANSAAIAANDAQHSGFGNCQLYTASYVGVGSGQPVTHTFPAKPMALLVGRSDSTLALIAWRGRDIGYDFQYSTVTWAENSATWTTPSGNSVSLNYPGYTYYILALLEQGA